MTCLILLMARYYGLRRTAWRWSCFLVGTVLATVYLGWHFAVDDVAGLAIAWVSVKLGRPLLEEISGKQFIFSVENFSAIFRISKLQTASRLNWCLRDIVPSPFCLFQFCSNSLPSVVCILWAGLALSLQR